MHISHTRHFCIGGLKEGLGNGQMLHAGLPQKDTQKPDRIEKLPE